MPRCRKPRYRAAARSVEASTKFACDAKGSAPDARSAETSRSRSRRTAATYVAVTRSPQRQRLLRQPDGGARKRKGRPAVAEVRDRRGRAQHGTHAKPRETPRLGQRPYDEDVFPLQQFPRRVAVGELDVGEIDEQRGVRRQAVGDGQDPLGGGHRSRGVVRRDHGDQPRPFPDPVEDRPERSGVVERGYRPHPTARERCEGRDHLERGSHGDHLPPAGEPPAAHAVDPVIRSRRDEDAVGSQIPGFAEGLLQAARLRIPRQGTRRHLREETDEFRRREQALVVIEPKPFARWRGHCQPAHATICPGVVTTRSVPPRAFTRGIRPGRVSRSTATRMA